MVKEGESMAEKRMLSKSFVNSASFMKMSDSAKLLYVYLNINADDDGVVEAYPFTQMLHTPEDDVKLLLTKGFIYFLNDDWLTFLPHWLQNQNLRADRYTPSIYRFKLLNSNPDFYAKVKPVSLEKIMNAGQTEPLRTDLMDKWYPNGIPRGDVRDTQLRLEKVSKDKSSIDKVSIDEVNKISGGYQLDDEVSSVFNQEGLKLVKTLGDRYEEFQRQKYIRLIISMKDSIEREFRIRIDGNHHYVETNRMLRRMFNCMNDKLNRGEKLDELSYINKVSRNHWKTIAEREEKSRKEVLDSLSNFKGG